MDNSSLSPLAGGGERRCGLDLATRVARIAAALRPSSSRRRPDARRTALRAFFRDPQVVVGLVLLTAILGLAAAADWLYLGDPLDTVAQPLLAPFENPGYPLGTDSLGRDIAAGIAHGARTSLFIGFVATAIGLALGVLIGGVGGYFGGWVDRLLLQLTELLQATPVFLLVVVIVALDRPTTMRISLAIGLTSWPIVARLLRAEFRSLLQCDFVLAARTQGFGDARIIFREILPNALPPIVAIASMKVATAILLESGLAFLGIGDANRISWGSMIGDGRELLRTAWHLTVEPGLALTATILSLNLIGDGLNDALNPRLRGESE